MALQIRICPVCNTAFLAYSRHGKKALRITCSTDCEHKLKMSGKFYLIKNKPLTEYIKETIIKLGDCKNISTKQIIKHNQTLRANDSNMLRQRIGRSIVSDFGYTKTSNTHFRKL